MELSCPLSYRQPGDSVASWVSGFRVQRSNSWESLPALLPSCGLQVIVLPFSVCACLSGAAAAPSCRPYHPRDFFPTTIRVCSGASQPVSQWSGNLKLAMPSSATFTCEFPLSWMRASLLSNHPSLTCSTGHRECAKRENCFSWPFVMS